MYSSILHIVFSSNSCGKHLIGDNNATAVTQSFNLIYMIDASMLKMCGINL